MTENASNDALLSSDRASEATTTDKEATKDNKPGNDGADNDATDAGKKSEPAEGDASKADGTETDKDDDADAPGDAEGAPETYQFEAPDGLEFNPDGLKSFEAIARKLDLNNAKAQELLGALGVELSDMAKAQVAAWDKETGETWVQAVMTDAEIGGTKEQVAEKLGIAKLAVEKFGDKDLDAVMTRFRLGNNPAFCRFMHRVGLTLQEDKSIHRGGVTPGERKSDREVFYGGEAA